MSTTAQKIGLSAIGQIAVTIKDVERAVAFYRDQLGIRLLFRAGNMAFFDCGGVRLMLTPPEQDQKEYSSIIYYRVSDIGAAHEALRGRGVVFRDAPHKIADLGTHELWLAFFADSEGNLLAIMSEIPKA